MKMSCIVLTTALSVSLFSVFAEKVQLARDGQPLAEIVLAEKADRAARFGALDLAWHLKEITGADFPIVTAKSGSKLPIYVGESAGTKAKQANFKKQEYVVDIRPDAIELVGFDDNDRKGKVALVDRQGHFVNQGWPDVHAMQGSMYAVYEFLEFTVGVKWLTQEPTGTMLPKDANLAVEVSMKRGRPCFSYRGGTMADGCDETVWGRKVKGKIAAYRELAFPGLNAQQIQALKLLFILRHRGCGSKNPVNHSFYHFYEQYWIRGHKHFVEYLPEIFAKGYPEGTEPPQLCYTHPKTKELVVKMIRDYFDHGGFKQRMRNIGTWGMIWGEDNFSIEPMDNGSMCKCAECKKLLDLDRAQSGHGRGESIYWFTFVRDIAQEILKSHPDKTISTLAYGGHEATPAGVALPPNVKVYFCPSGNRQEPRSEYFKGQMARMHDWHEQYPNTKLGVWFYDTFPYEFYGNAGYQGPHGYFGHEAIRQYRELRSLNATDGIFHCGLPGSVCIYMAFEAMVNPDREADELLDEYFSQFGAAAKPLRKFYDIVERRWCDPALRVPDKQAQALYWTSVCPAPVMQELAALVAEAERLVKTDVEKLRFAYWKFDNWDYMKTGFDSYMTRASAPMPTWAATRVAAAEGELAKVEWDKVPAADMPMYNRGGETPAELFGKEPFKVSRRVANDGQWLYLELVQHRDTKTVVHSPDVVPYDTWEFSLARQRALPNRYFMAGSDGHIFALSNGEINFRMNVKSSEICNDKAFFVRCTGDITAPDRWVARFAIPLDRAFDRPVAPGESVYFTPVTVISPKGCGSSPYGIYSGVTYTGVHTFDRAIEIKLAK